MNLRGSVTVGLAPALVSLAGCRSPDLSAVAEYYEREPLSILVLPVRNDTTDAEASRFFMATIHKPLVGRGYYVFPMETVAEVLASEGLSEGGLAWEAAPERYAEYLGCDAILYVTITEWDTTYIVLRSAVTVGMHYRLVDCRSSEVIWENRSRRTVTSGSSGYYGGSAAGALIGLAVDAVDAAVTAAMTDYVPLAFQANAQALAALPPGAYSPERADVRRRVAEWKALQEKERREDVVENEDGREK